MPPVNCGGTRQDGVDGRLESSRGSILQVCVNFLLHFMLNAFKVIVYLKNIIRYLQMYISSHHRSDMDTPNPLLVLPLPHNPS